MGITSLRQALTPMEAFSIDNKADDGKPNTGVFVSPGGACMGAGFTNCWQAVPVAGIACITGGVSANDTQAVYATGSDALSNSIACTQASRFQ
jgi:hypothetical protein